MINFIVSSIQKEADVVIRQSEIIRLTQENQMRFLNALMEPTKPNRALEKAFERRQKLLKFSAI
jgi:uncharacterized protein (DUF1778 family)